MVTQNDPKKNLNFMSKKNNNQMNVQFNSQVKCVLKIINR